MSRLAARALAQMGEALNAYRTHQATTGAAMSTESDAVDEANPLGKSPEEVDRSNRWFNVAVAMGKQDEYVEMLATERRLAVAAATDLTEHDAHDRLWFNSGWEACRREVLAVAEHQGEAEAVDWASRHPAEQETTNG